MNPRFLPWVKLAWVWVTAVILCLITIVVLVWQTSGPGGRQGLIKSQIEELRADISRMQHMNVQAADERFQVAETSAGLERIRREVFGRFEERLTAVMREIGTASRSAGLLPGGFSYSVVEVRGTDGLRFSTSFSVDGTFEQVRNLLTMLQNSPQFLIIESIGFVGEEDPRSSNLRIRLRVASFLTEVESERLRSLIEMLEFDRPGDEVAEAADDVIEADADGYDESVTDESIVDEVVVSGIEEVTETGEAS